MSCNNRSIQSRSDTSSNSSSSSAPLVEHGAECQQMLIEQFEARWTGTQRPLFEFLTSTFNVSCHLVAQLQLQCVL